MQARVLKKKAPRQCISLKILYVSDYTQNGNDNKDVSDNSNNWYNNDNNSNNDNTATENYEGKKDELKILRSICAELLRIETTCSLSSSAGTSTHNAPATAETAHLMGASRLYEILGTLNSLKALKDALKLHM